ncbi:DUF6127 family protein [Govanella unica]|uniref:DUF6127 family protein n=1 Tax=Govanella unica TaxID=2975056 RepID=A0A9X3TZZ9_9PROT|nr:DUF6127 family protein [Govania unica]MDA5194938.1 DUF6127 family protein [Govania unica]
MTAQDPFPFYAYARLVQQAQLEGATIETLRLLIEEASAHGAARALARCGLEDAAAGSDIGELRALLDAWRDSKRAARRAAVRWLTRAFLASLMAAIAFKLRVIDWR